MSKNRKVLSTSISNKHSRSVGWSYVSGDSTRELPREWGRVKYCLHVGGRGQDLSVTQKKMKYICSPGTDRAKAKRTID